MVSPTKLTVHSGKEEPISQSVSVSHLKTRKFWKQFAPLWKVWVWKLEVLFLEGDDTGTFIVPALDVRAQVLSIKERRNSVRSKYSNLFHMETDSCLLLLLLICVFLVFQMEFCNRSSLKPERPMCDDRLFASPPGRSRHLFPRFPFSMGASIDRLFGSLPDLHHVVPLFCCPMASLERIRIVCCRRFSQPGISIWFATRRCRPSPSHAYKWAHYPWVADGSTCRIQQIEPFIFPWRSTWLTTRRRSPCSSTFTLEERCSSTTSSTTRWCRLKHVCPYSW